MAKMNKGIEDFNYSKKNSSGSAYNPSIGISKSESVATSTETRTTGKTNVTPLLTHQQIEERARAIWKQKGCPAGQDEKNWLEAEAQLKKELASK
jgi:hypothetical protein